MPSYVIHLATAEEYLKKHRTKKEDYDDFMQGVIYPDNVEDKTKTHYATDSSQSNLSKFLQEYHVDNSFKRGYFLHLLTDYLFYNQCIEYWSKDIYCDYDILNRTIMQKYGVVLPKGVPDCVHFESNAKLKILSLEQVEEFIDKVSSMDINTIVKEVQENPEKWTRFKILEENKKEEKE